MSTIYKIKVVKVIQEWEKTRSWEKLRDRIENDEKDNYGYVESEQLVTREKDIYEQTVEGEINLRGIIEAVNEEI